MTAIVRTGARPTRVLVLAIAALAAIIPTAAADPRQLKSNVVIVRPHFHERTRQAFADLAIQVLGAAESAARDERLASYTSALAGLARYLNALATSPGHGSGWIWIPPASDVAYVVTNKHVAGQAGTVTIEFDRGRHPALVDNPVLYVDPLHDLAVIEVDRRRLPADATGFELTESPLGEGSPVWAAGFPGTVTERGMIATYSLTDGSVSNAEFPGPEGAAIAHTATIDPGNSGGPLLVEVETAPLGYRVAGMNTWKRNDRTNLNLSVPAPVIAQALRTALESRQIGRDRARLTAELRRSARRLADELGSTRPDGALLEGMISYSFVAQRPQILDYLVQQLVARKLDTADVDAFVESPVEFARTLLARLFFATFSTGRSSVGAVRLDSITDEDRIGTAAEVRSLYDVGGKRQEVIWTWEHGAWRISNASFEQAFGGNTVGAGNAGISNAATDERPTAVRRATPTARPHRPRPGVALAVRVARGTAGAIEDGVGGTGGYASTAVGVELRVPLSRHLWLTAGAAYDPLGVEYTARTVEGTLFDVHEAVTSLQVPLGVRLELPIERSSVTARLFGRASVSTDIAVKRCGWFEIRGQRGSLCDPELGWYDEHNEINAGAQVGGGIEIGFGRAPSIFVGVDVSHERHLLPEWTDEAFSGGANYRYQATRVGLLLTYQGRRD